MSKILRKTAIVGLSVVTAVGLSGGVFVSHGQSTADLQAQIQALLAQIAALQAQLNAQQGGGAAVQCNFTRNLTVGSQGEDVRCLQQYLNSAGFQVAASGPGSPGNETSFFGPLTRAAVAKWQEANAAAVLAPVGLSSGTGFWGPSSIGHYNSLVAGGQVPAPEVPGVPVPASGVALSLSAGNPAGATIPQGAAGVTFLEFNVAGNGTLNSLTFERKGAGATGDFSNVYLYEGNTRLTSGRTVNSTTHQVFFASLGLNVSGVRTLRLVGDVSADATAANEHRFELVGSSGSPSVSGSLVGNTMRIGGVKVGTIKVSATSTPANPSVGQRGALLADFELSAGTGEDLSLRRVTLTHGGNLSRSRLSNLELRIAGETVASAGSPDSSDRVTFVLPSPYNLDKGQVVTLRVYGDIAADSRKDDTIKFYIDSGADLEAIGATHGFPATPTITGFNSADAAAELKLQAGKVTVSDLSPVAQDIGLRANDVEVGRFSIAALNNVEIKNLRVQASTTAASGSNPKFNDMKVWDVDTNQVLTSSKDVTSSTVDYVYSDRINISAGQTRTFKVTVDVDSANKNDDAIHVGLKNFNASDIRNLDNNTDVATADIVGTPFTGRKQTVKTPQVDVQLAGSPTSQTVAAGAADVDLVGFAFKAVADDITLTSVKVHASSSSGTLTSSEIVSLRLMDGSTVLGTKSLASDGNAFSATFDGLNVVIPRGATKTLKVRGNIASDAGANDHYYAYINAVTTGSINAKDSGGRSIASADITGTAANSDKAVVVRVASAGTVTSAVAPSDDEVDAGIVVAGGERVLAKFRFTAENENMTLNKLKILVNTTNSATATSTTSGKYVPRIKLFDGSTQIGAADGYVVAASGDNAGVVEIQNLGWVLPQDSTKTLVVKGVLASIDRIDRPMGQSLFAHLQSSGFEAVGAASGDTDTTITARSGNEKVVYASAPSFTSLTGPSQLSATNVFTFKLKADGAKFAWKQVQFKVVLTGATMSAVDANPGTNGNVTLKRVGASSNLNIASAFSSTSTSTGEQAAIVGTTGYVSLLLNTEEEISAGAEQAYELTLPSVTQIDTGDQLQLSIQKTETTLVNATTLSDVRSSLGTATDAAPSFVWSDTTADNTTAVHSDSTKDWANGVYVKIIPGLVTIQK